MTSITDLPLEVVSSILRELDGVSSLPSALLACKHFFNAFSADRKLAYDILRRCIGSESLPYAVANFEASRLPEPCDKASAKDLLDRLFEKPAQLAEQAKAMGIGELVKIGNLHDIVHSLATDFMCEAWSLLGQADLILYSSEYTRACRAFYRVELFFSLFRKDDRDFGTENERQLFMKRYSPWVVEQIGCVYDYLEKRLSKAIFTVLSQDIEFGEVSVDYISCGENYWKQLWLSQGLSFIHRLTTATSDEAKKDMLKSHLGQSTALLYDSFPVDRDEATDSDVPLAEYSDEQLAKLTSALDDGDTDTGPFKAWYAAYSDQPCDCWAMLLDNGGRRERAYVLWDWERVESRGLLRAFEDAPEPEHWSGDEDAMLRSFEERSKIWQIGGKGFWKEGDLSGITWPKNCMHAPSGDKVPSESGT